MEPLILTSWLDAARRGELERVLFFNRNQPRVQRGASAAVDRYGAPRISLRRDGLWITLDSDIETQTLFVLDRAGSDGQLVGVVVYTREADTLAVLFLALREDYAQGGDRAGELMFVHILDELRRLAHRIKGIARIRLFLTDPPTSIEVGGRAV